MLSKDDKSAKITQYLTNFNDINGYMEPRDAAFFVMMYNIQLELYSNSLKELNAVEIGVHYGKSAAILSILYDKLFAFDLFEGLQNQNISQSGHGHYGFAKDQITKFGNINSTELIIENSNNLTPEYFNKLPIDLFHIDGGHDYETTLNDIVLGSKVISDNGFIVVDDCASRGWPGIIQAYCEFLSTNKNIVPVVISQNKIWLCKRDLYNKVYSFMTDANLAMYGITQEHRNTVLFGKRICVFTNV